MTIKIASKTRSQRFITFTLSICLVLLSCVLFAPRIAKAAQTCTDEVETETVPCDGGMNGSMSRTRVKHTCVDSGGGNVWISCGTYGNDSHSSAHGNGEMTNTVGGTHYPIDCYSQKDSAPVFGTADYSTFMGFSTYRNIPEDCTPSSYMKYNITGNYTKGIIYQCIAGNGSWTSCGGRSGNTGTGCATDYNWMGSYFASTVMDDTEIPTCNTGSPGGKACSNGTTQGYHGEAYLCATTDGSQVFSCE